MKGTTLTELNRAYDRQAGRLAWRTEQSAGWKSTDIFFWECGYQKRKLHPRGKTFNRLLTLCKQADFYD
ncbi:TPA: hypothetical protein ACH0SE_002268 [Providencia rettgeri]